MKSKKKRITRRGKRGTKQGGVGKGQLLFTEKKYVIFTQNPRKILNKH